MDGHNERKSIVIAEQWLKEEKTRNVIVYTGWTGRKPPAPRTSTTQPARRPAMQLQYLRNYTDKYQCVKWRTMSGATILETPKNADGSEALYPADAIGIVPVYGYWGVKDGRMTYCGIPRRAIAIRSAPTTTTRASCWPTWAARRSRRSMAPVRAIKGLEALWDRASTDSRAYLPYNDVDENGQPIARRPVPNIAVNLQNHIAGAEQALHDLEATIGMYQANLGAPSNETSGVAIDARKEQGEASTSHFPQNLAASLGQVGRICLQMVAKLIDTKRQQRIMGIDMTPASVTVDPEQQQGASSRPTGREHQPERRHLRRARGGRRELQHPAQPGADGAVRGDAQQPGTDAGDRPAVGAEPGHPARRQAGAGAGRDGASCGAGDPEPGHGQAAQAEQLMQQNEQLKQGCKEAIQHAHDAQAEADQAQDKLRDKEAEDTRSRHQAYNAETRA
jgi:hypothetical protein